MKSITVLGSLLAGISVASPLSSIKTLAGRDEVTPELVEKFKEYIQWSTAAVCNDGRDPGSILTCGGNCPKVESANATMVQPFRGPNTELTGFVGIDHTNSQIVVSFRSTHTFWNWMTDFDYFKDQGFCDGCWIHQGFSSAWEEVLVPAQTAVQNELERNPQYSVVVTGHSLGGAVATLAATTLRLGGTPCDLYTYGSPRVGNEAFAEHVTNRPENTYRLTHFNDFVPTLPPISWPFSYRHTSPEYWLESGPFDRTDYAPNEIQVCIGTANTECNDRYWADWATDAHSYYFQEVGNCGRNADPVSFITEEQVESMKTIFNRTLEEEQRR